MADRHDSSHDTHTSPKRKRGGTAIRPSLALRAGVMLHRRVPMLLSTITVALLAGQSASAHKAEIVVTVRGDVIHGEVAFAGGDAVARAQVEIVDGDGKRLGTTRTDDAGRFTFRPSTRCDHRLLIDAGGGHYVAHTVKVDQLPTSLAAASPADSDLADQVERLQRNVQRLAQRTQLRDVLGGLGFIAGIVGVWFYLKGLALRRSGGSN